MKKSHVLSALALILTMAIPAVASAEKGAKYSDKAGRFGIGSDTSLGGVNGLSARFQVAKNFGVQAIVSFVRVSFDTKQDTDDTTVSTTTVQQIGGALRGDIGLAYTNRASLSVVFGVDFFSDSSSIEFTSAAVDNVEDSQTRFAFEAGLKTEYSVTNFISFHVEVGFVFALINRAEEISFITSRAGVPVGAGGGGDGNSIDGSVIVFGIGDLWGNAGVTFWFN